MSPSPVLADRARRTRLLRPRGDATVRLVVLDLDDTLFLERDYVRSGFLEVGNLVRRELGWSRFFKAAWTRFVEGRRDMIFDRALEAVGVSPNPEFIRTLLECYRTHLPRVQLCPDARRFLSRPPGGVALGVVTDGRPGPQALKVRALGVDRFVDAVECTGQWGPRFAKPHPRAFRLMERRFGLEGSACMYVGDNPARDFQGPIGLGWSVCRIRRPGGMLESAESPGVPEIETLDELAAVLGQGE